MKVSIDITEAVNGWRLDIYDDRLPTTFGFKENFKTYNSLIVALAVWVKKEEGNKIKWPFNV